MNVWNSDVIASNLDLQDDINEKIRSIVVDWIFEIADAYEYSDIYIHRTVRILDIVISAHQIKRDDMQVISSAIFSIVDMYFSHLVLTDIDWIDIAANSFTSEEFFHWQIKILNILDYDLFFQTYYDLVLKELSGCYSAEEKTHCTIISNYLLYHDVVTSSDIKKISNMIVQIVKRNIPEKISSLYYNIICLIRSINTIDTVRLDVFRKIHKTETPEFQSLIKYLQIFSTPEPPEFEIKVGWKKPDDAFNFANAVVNEKVIGEGVYGSVYSIISDNRTYALKRFKAGKLTQSIVREAVAMKKIDSPNVLKMYKMVVINGKKTGLVTQLCDIDLFDWIYHKHNPKKVNSIIMGIIDGLYDIHSKGFIHRDLKPANILMCNDTPMICDFGISSHVDIYNDSEGRIYDTFTLYYRPPELLLGGIPNLRSADIWALGCVIYELLTCKILINSGVIDNLPIRANTQLEAIFKIFGTVQSDEAKYFPEFKQKFPKYNATKKISTELSGLITPVQIKLLESMFIYNPDQRITISKIKKNWNS